MPSSCIKVFTYTCAPNYWTKNNSKIKTESQITLLKTPTITIAVLTFSNKMRYKIYNTTRVAKNNKFKIYMHIFDCPSVPFLTALFNSIILFKKLMKRIILQLNAKLINRLSLILILLSRPLSVILLVVTINAMNVVTAAIPKTTKNILILLECLRVSRLPVIY